MYVDKEKYLSHIKDEEQILNMRKVIDKIEIACNSHNIQYTNFLSPYERRLAISILNGVNCVSYLEDGGFDNAERKIIAIFPSYYSFDIGNSPITPISITGNVSNLSHGDFLGAILNLGISREKVGDILLHEDDVQVIVDSAIANYIIGNLKKVNKRSVSANIIPRVKVNKGIINFKEVVFTLPSLRLDNVVSNTFKISRKESINIIRNGKVKVNWEPIEKIHYEVNEGDLISVRGHGRFIFDSILYKTKKDRLKVSVRIIL